MPSGNWRFARPISSQAGASFDGTNDYMTRGAAITGIADGKVGSMAFRINFLGGDASNVNILHDSGFDFYIRRNNTDKLNVRGRDTSNNADLAIVSTSDWNSADDTINVLISWDLAAGAANLYVDDSDDKGSTTTTDDNIDLTATNWGVGANATGGGKLNADLYFFWFTNEYIDFSTEANRRLFFDSGGTPVWLGSHGQNPTGTQPLLYFNKNFNNFQINMGSGGPFTVTGALTQPA